MQRKVEGYRRVDIITKGKMEILEDRITQLGRQYYDAVSELAVLKGEVPDSAERRAQAVTGRNLEELRGATLTETKEDPHGAEGPDNPDSPPHPMVVGPGEEKPQRIGGR